MVLHFGKYKGQDLEDVPDHYLEWLDEQDWVVGLLRRELDKELVSRYLKEPAVVAQPANQLKIITTVYKELAKKFHPDLGGSTAAMQALNEFYGELKQHLK